MTLSCPVVDDAKIIWLFYYGPVTALIAEMEVTSVDVSPTDVWGAKSVGVVSVRNDRTFHPDGACDINRTRHEYVGGSRRVGRPKPDVGCRARVSALTNIHVLRVTSRCYAMAKVQSRVTSSACSNV